MKGSGSARSRQMAILRHLKNAGRASVEELADAFTATPQTIRKDLNTLADAGEILRFHGGATLVAGTEYTHFVARAEIARAEKEQIGRRVAAEIPNNSSLLINSGTTTTAIVPHLRQHVGLKIMTDSVDLANLLRSCTGVEVMVPAGVVRASDGAILGNDAVEYIRNFRADIGIIGAAAIAEDGALLDYDVREASVTRAIMVAARNVFLVADSSKFGRAAPFCFGDLAQVDQLISDKGCPEPLRALCAAKDVSLVS